MHKLRAVTLAVAVLLSFTGCDRAQTAPPPASTPLQGQAIDAPAPAKLPAVATPNPNAPGLPGALRQAPTDPAERAALAVEAPAPTARDGYAEVTFSQLASFTYETDMDGRLTPESRFPEEIASLDNRKVAVSGYLIPIEFEEDKVSSLILVRNQLLCCFGEEPKLNEWIFVNADPPVEAVMDLPVTVYGTLYASPDREEQQVISLYRMQAQAMVTMP